MFKFETLLKHLNVTVKHKENAEGSVETGHAKGKLKLNPNLTPS